MLNFKFVFTICLLLLGFLVISGFPTDESESAPINSNILRGKGPIFLFWYIKLLNFPEVVYLFVL